MTSSASLCTRSIASPVQLQRSITASVSVTSNGRHIAPLSSQHSRSSIVTVGACQPSPAWPMLSRPPALSARRAGGRSPCGLSRVGLSPSLDLTRPLDHGPLVSDERRHPLVAGQPLNLLAAG